MTNSTNSAKTNPIHSPAQQPVPHIPAPEHKTADHKTVDHKTVEPALAPAVAPATKA